MDTKYKKHPVYEDEINVYDYWMVVVKRKTLIIGLFLVSVLASAVISLLMPKIYRGEVVLKLPEKQPLLSITITAKELTAKELLGLIDIKNKEKFFPTTYHLITNIKLNALRDSTDKFQLIIEAKNTDNIPSAITEFVAYLNNFPLISRSVEEERQRLLKQSETLSKAIKESDELAQMYKKLLKEGKPILFGFNPVEIKKKSSDMEVERLAIEQALKRPNGVEIIESPYIPKDSVNPNIKKNIVLGGLISIFAGVLAAFFLEYVKKKDKNQVRVRKKA